MKRALIFFPHNPFPPRSGAHARCLQIVGGLRALGWEVTLASSDYTSENSWDEVSERALSDAGLPQLEVHRAGRTELQYLNVYIRSKRLLGQRAGLSSDAQCPPFLRRWFSRLYDQLQPDLVLISYAFWDRLVTAPMHARTLTVMDSLDLVTLYRKRFEIMARELPPRPIAPDSVNPDLLREDFFDQVRATVSPDEYQIYDHFGVTIAITPYDAQLIRENTSHTRVMLLPMTVRTVEHASTYAGAAIFPTGPNPFNVQGYLYFVQRVLPIVRDAIPDFRLVVTGGVCQQVFPVPGVELIGFAPDLSELLRTARFLVCPILGKTGLQIKIIEAMALGVPVVATRVAAEGGPLHNGENGFVASNASKFAAHVIRLWNDPALCRRMGQAARATIAAEYSDARLMVGLRELLPEAIPA